MSSASKPAASLVPPGVAMSFPPEIIGSNFCAVAGSQDQRALSPVEESAMTKIVCSGEQTFPSGDTVARSAPANTSLQPRSEPREGARTMTIEKAVPPDVTGMRHEFVIQRAHRFSYDQSFRVPGGVLVEIGLGRRTMPFELENAIGLATGGSSISSGPSRARRGSYPSR